MTSSNPKGKTAEDVAEEIFFSVFVMPEVIDPTEVKRRVAQALINFADKAHLQGIMEGCSCASNEPCILHEPMILKAAASMRSRCADVFEEHYPEEKVIAGAMRNLPLLPPEAEKESGERV